MTTGAPRPAKGTPLHEDVFRALADPSRRQLLDRLRERGGQSLRELCSGLDMARQSVSKHLDILEAANLVATIRRGREKLHYLNAAPINDIAERWISEFHRGRVEALADLKRALEETSMDKPEFVYTTYIKTTPERLWQALTDPAFTKRYWGLTFDTDWKRGSNMRWEQFGITIADTDQRVLEAEPYTRLAYTWHTFTDEWARVNNYDAAKAAKIKTEPRSKVTFTLAPVGQSVKLTVVHDGFEPGSAVLESVSGGWPLVIANLKTFLETGEPIPAA